MKNLNRREFIKLTGTGLGAVYLGGCATAFSREPSQVGLGAQNLTPHSLLSPIDRTRGDRAPRLFTGDQPSRPHRILWEKERFISSLEGGLPKPTEHFEVTVVGGGISGLSSAYLLRDKKPLLLEQASRFGGNAKGESWKGLDYSIGAAYFSLPHEGSPVSEFFKELGMNQKLAYHNEEEPVFISGKKYDGIWEKGTLPENREQFRRLRRYFTEVAAGSHGKTYPEIPTQDFKIRREVNQLDQISFKGQLEKILKAPLHTHLYEILEHYCWSAFAASSSEISAAAGLNFFAGDFAGIAVAPGGNSGVAEALFNVLSKDSGASRLRSSSLVFDVQVVKDGVHVSYMDAEEKVKTIHSKYVILSCPKFVVKKLIGDLEPERLKVLEDLRYRAYLVANVLVSQGLPKNFYDVEFFEAQGSGTDTKKASDFQKVSDITYGNYSQPDPARTVLTLYRALPYDGARAEVYDPNAYERFRSEFEQQVNEQILPLLKLSQKDVVDLRITRWGHPLPVPDVGTYASGKVDWLRKPFKERVYFAEQDNWMLPSFESGFSEAQHWTAEVRKKL